MDTGRCVSSSIETLLSKHLTLISVSIGCMCTYTCEGQRTTSGHSLASVL